MNVITNFAQYQGEPGATSIAIGGFDGIHLAHCAIIKRVTADRRLGLIPAVFTFDTCPEASFKGVPVLTTNPQRLALLESMGVERVYLPSFGDVKNLTAEEFVEQVLVEQCGAKRIACGFNFHFGKGGRAGVEELRRLCAGFGVKVEVVPEILLDGQTVSSTQIRQQVQEGDMENAARFLGRPFSLAFSVEHGRKLGRQIGVPTMNQRIPQGFVEPRYGVYASVVELPCGRRYYGVTNVGVKPTVGSDYAILETWIPDFSGDLYGKTIPVALRHFLRPEKKFPDLDALRRQIQQDRMAAQDWVLRHLPGEALENLDPVIN